MQQAPDVLAGATRHDEPSEEDNFCVSSALDSIEERVPEFSDPQNAIWEMDQSLRRLTLEVEDPED